MLTSYIISLGAISFLSIFGIIGNSIGCYILSQPKLKSQTTFHYFYINCIMSHIVLGYIWGHFIPILFDIQWLDIYCKTYFYFGTIMQQTYPWINVLNSIDRLFSLKYPSKFLIRKQFKYHIIMIFMIILIQSLINIPYTIYEGPNMNGTDFKCYIENKLASYFISGSNFLISSFIPFSIMATSSLLLIYFMVKQ